VDIAYDDLGEYSFVDTNGKIQTRINDEWFYIFNNQYPGSAKRIAILDDFTYVINDQYDIYRCERVYGSCARFGYQKASDISTNHDGDGSIWIVSTTPVAGGYSIMYSKDGSS